MLVRMRSVVILQGTAPLAISGSLMINVCRYFQEITDIRNEFLRWQLASVIADSKLVWRLEFPPEVLTRRRQIGVVVICCRKLIGYVNNVIRNVQDHLWNCEFPCRPLFERWLELLVKAKTREEWKSEVVKARYDPWIASAEAICNSS